MQEKMTLAAVFTAALLGSPHCAGMCGGFVAFCSGESKTPVRSTLLYNLGRLTTYSILGALVGYLGKSLDAAGISLLGFQKITAWITGALLIFWGIKGLLKGNLFNTNQSNSPSFKFISKIFGKILQGKEISWSFKGYLIGAMSTFLPCGFLYMFVAIAATSGNSTKGAITMAVFWAATVPVMATVAGLTRVLSSNLRKYVPQVTSILLILAGIWSIRFAPMSHHGKHNMSHTLPIEQSVDNPKSEHLHHMKM